MIVVMPTAATVIVDTSVGESAEYSKGHSHNQKPAAENHTFHFAKHDFSPFVNHLPTSVRPMLKVSYAIYGPVR